MVDPARDVADTVAPLLRPEGWALLDRLAAYDPATAMALGQRLRAAGHDPATVSAALTQSRLRAQARDKFGDAADRMLLTASGLEQATRRQVAAHHAARYVAAGATCVADLGCGIGADSMALAEAGLAVIAIERDPTTAAVAAVNLRPWPRAVVRCEDVQEGLLAHLPVAGPFGAADAAFVDPSRRAASGGGQRRVLDPRKATPPWSFVLDLASRLDAVGCKSAPGIPHDLIPPGTEAQWVSVDGDVVEAGVWFGRLARPHVRRAALLLAGDQVHEVTDAGTDPRTSTAATPVGAVGAVLYEPNPAVIRAGLLGQVAAQVNGRLLDPTIAYVSADALVPTPLARSYEVLDVFAFGLKPLRAWAREHRIGRITIKKRGTAVDPDVLRRQLRLSGDEEATIVLTRVAGKQSVLVVSPHPPAGRPRAR